MSITHTDESTNPLQPRRWSNWRATGGRPSYLTIRHIVSGRANLIRPPGNLLANLKLATAERSSFQAADGHCMCNWWRARSSKFGALHGSESKPEPDLHISNPERPHPSRSGRDLDGSHTLLLAWCTPRRGFQFCLPSRARSMLIVGSREHAKTEPRGLASELLAQRAHISHVRRSIVDPAG